MSAPGPAKEGRRAGASRRQPATPAPIDWTVIDHPGWQPFLDSLSTAVSIYDADLRLVSANCAFYEFAGLAEGQHRQRPSYISIVEQLARRGWYGEDESIEQLVATRIASLERAGFQHFRMTTPSGKTLDIRLDFLKCGGFITMMTDITDLETENQGLRLAALQDPLTKLGNRRHFERELGGSVDLVERTGDTSALLLFDLDGFKAVNDTSGHPAGDDLLSAVADALRGCIRKVDFAARLGGDEFAVIVRGLRSRGEALKAAREIDGRLRDEVAAIGSEPPIGVSGGAAFITAERPEPAAVVAAADQALYQAKGAGKGRLSIAG